MRSLKSSSSISEYYKYIFEKAKPPVESLSAVVLLSMIVLLLYGIGTREFASLYDFGVAELSLILSIWIVFVMLPVITYDENHIQINYFYQKLSPVRRHYTDIVRYVTMAVASILLLISSLRVTEDFLVGTTPVMGLPRYMFSIPFVFGFSLLSIIYCYRLVGALTEGSDENVNND